MNILARIAVPVLLIALAACTPQAVKPTAPEPPAPVPVAPAPVPKPPPPLALPQIIAMLESGEFDTARTQLKLTTAAEPGNLAARQLLTQITTDPRRYFGSTHTSHTVEAGESLAGLARRYLGHALEFVALARYNNIAQPRLLQAGQTLRIPTGYRSPLAGGTPKPVADAAASSAEVDVLERDWPPPEGLEPAILGERYRERIDALLKAQRFDDAAATVADARQRQPPGDAWAPWLNPLDTRANALLWQSRGIAQMAVATVDSRQAAYDDLGKALALIPALEPARTHRQTLLQALVLDYHEAAIVQYRNQQLDEALALWDKALALDPQFAPAQGYRTRALELKRRLRDLEAETPEPATPLPAVER